MGFALFLAASEGTPGAIKLLLAAGADANFAASGETPLLQAAYCGQVACVRQLLAGVVVRE